MTVQEVLKEFSPLIKDGEVQLLDLEVLLSFVLGEDKTYLISHADEEVGEELLELFKGYVERARKGEPIAYITNVKEFYGLQFYVDKRVLVPRPETELLVDKAIDYIRSNKEDISILDMGTGCGNIPIAIVKGLDPEEHKYLSKVEGLDVSDEAIDVARMNAEQHGIEEKVYFFQSDLLDAIEPNSTYEIILANLPYVGENKNHFVEKNVEDNEPAVALFGGDDGLELYRNFFQQVLDKNIKFGIIVGEFGFAQGEEMMKILDNFFPGKWLIEKDNAGIERVFEVKY
ncbi:peptide chain release factor N(5)-glutamine methyltransferase [Patescibacteria group bacterium]